MQAETYQPPASKSLMSILQAAMAGAHTASSITCMFGNRINFLCYLTNGDKQCTQSATTATQAMDTIRAGIEVSRQVHKIRHVPAEVPPSRHCSRKSIAFHTTLFHTRGRS